MGPVQCRLKGNLENGIAASQLIDTVFAGIEEKRDTAFARQVYGELDSLQCIWTGRLLKTDRNLAVDHVIPFSLWHNNNLWNLMPADDQVNNQKRDKLPRVNFSSPGHRICVLTGNSCLSATGPASALRHGAFLGPLISAAEKKVLMTFFGPLPRLSRSPPYSALFHAGNHRKQSV